MFYIYVHQWVTEELMQGAPYSADLIHRGHENPQFEVDIQRSSLREFQIRDNKQGIFVEVPSELLLD
jgi:hypothetical protein